MGKKTRTLRAKDAVDVLAMVPCMLGFHPERSLVLITLGGSDGGFHARLDLPEDSADIPELLSGVKHALARIRGRRVVVVTYTDDHRLSMELLGAVGEMLEAHDVDIVEAVRSDGERWYSLTCTDRCCPPKGKPYDISAHPFVAESVLHGQVILASRKELQASLTAADDHACAAATLAVDRALSRFEAAARHPFGPPDPRQARAHAVGEGRWVRDRVRRHLRDGQPLGAEDAGRMLVALVSIEVRDVAWAEMSQANAHRHVRLWRELVRQAPDDLAAAPAALLGFAAWISGDGALAWCAVERCQRADSGYSLARLLSTALAGAVPPSVWKPISREDLTLFAG